MNGFERRKEQKKKEILEATLDLFMEFGIQKPSIAEIAAKAGVSQVTIYNYFESKHKLTYEVFIYYLEKASAEFEQLVNSDLEFPKKIKQIIFKKKEAARHIHVDLYEYFMKSYSTGPEYIKQLYLEKGLPRFIRLFEEGKAQGYISSNLSNEAILFYLQAMSEYLQREEVYQYALPLTEDIINILFYGITGKRETKFSGE